MLALEAAAGRPLTQRLLKQLAKDNPQIPSYSIIQRQAARDVAVIERSAPRRDHPPAPRS